jgi:hypothetical protein
MQIAPPTALNLSLDVIRKKVDACDMDGAMPIIDINRIIAIASQQSQSIKYKMSRQIRVLSWPKVNPVPRTTFANNERNRL